MPVERLQWVPFALLAVLVIVAALAVVAAAYLAAKRWWS